jgi:hypothetical protein
MKGLLKNEKLVKSIDGKVEKTAEVFGKTQRGDISFPPL